MPNVGQFDERVLAMAPTIGGGAAPAWITRDGFAVRAPGAATALRFEFIGAAGDAECFGLEPLAARFHYLHGTDPSAWFADVESFAAMRVNGVLPGVDVEYRSRDGRLAYDLHLADPGALASIEVRCVGARRLALTESGDLSIETASGSIVQSAPRAFRVDPGGWSAPVASRFVLRGKDRFGFAADATGAGDRLVVDPSIVWSATVGGSTFDSCFGVSADASGAAYTCGVTESNDFPSSASAPDQTGVGSEAFVAKFDPSGSLVWATYLGGAGTDIAFDIAVRDPGSGPQAFVAGTTDSTDFPTTPGALRRTNAGMQDLFVARLNAAGSALLYSTYLGGMFDDGGTPVTSELRVSIAVDSNGRATVAAMTASPNFPVTAGAFDMALGAGAGASASDVAVARITAAGSALVWSTFLGGSGVEEFGGIALRGDGSVLVSGTTDSTDFPIAVSTVQAKPGSPFGVPGDAFVACLASNGASLIHSSYLGDGRTDIGRGVATDASGAAYVSTCTDQNFGGFEGSRFHTLRKISAAGNAVLWSSNFDNFPLAVRTGPGGEIFTQTAQRFGCCHFLTWLTRFLPNGEFVVRQFGDYEAIAPVSGEDVLAVGSRYASASADIQAAVDRVKLDCRASFTDFGAGCPAPTGITPKLHATGCPTLAPGTSVRLSLSQATPDRAGILVLGIGTQPVPVRVGCALSIGPILSTYVVPITTLDETISGVAWSATIDAPATPPAVVAPFDVYLQALIAAAPGVAGIAVSNAIHAHVDP